MEPRFSRRGFMNTAIGLGLAAQRSLGQQVAANDRRPVVAVVKGEERRKIVHDALVAIDDQIKPVLQRKKYVVLKPNNVSTVNQLAATHLDALRGILDYLAPRFKGPVVIAESSAGNTMEGFENFRYGQLTSEFKSQHVTLTDLNEEAEYQLVQVLDENLHIIPVRLAARLLDPDAFVLCPAILKTHNTVVATLSVKNMVLGAPLHQAPKETKRWNDKRKFHTGLRQTHYNMMVTAQKMAPFWGATVIDGYEGMEGNGPASGTPVPSRVAIASTDFIAADRVGVEAMGIDASWLAYLQYCSAAGIGQYDLAKIALRGEPLAGVRRSYRMHGDIERELRWRGPMTDIPEKIG